MPLNNREMEALGLLAKGLKISDLATTMCFTRNTASDYVKSIYRKLNISFRAQAALHAARMGLVDCPPYAGLPCHGPRATLRTDPFILARQASFIHLELA